MQNRRRKHFRKIKFHPITTFIILTIFVMILSSFLSIFFEQVNGLFNIKGFKHLIESAANNFVSFNPLKTLLIGLIGLSVAHASGFIDTFIKRVTLKINNKTITFIIILIATISSIINDVGYVILIPLAALVFLANRRNPLLGITAAFCGVAFGYGVTIFAGSMEMNLVKYTEQAVNMQYHVSLLSNLYAIIIASIVLSIVGTFIIENIISKRIGRYHLTNEEESTETKEIKIESVEQEQQKRLEEDINEKRGLKYASIAFLIFVLLFAYMIIPGLPGSGLLLDMEEKAYIYQLFGEKGYFKKGFTFLISVMFLVVGVAYAKGAKTVKSDNELIKKASDYLKDVGYLCAFIFFAAQFIAVFKETNIGNYIISLISDVIVNIPFSGIPLIIAVMLLIAFSGLFVTTQTIKWTLYAPVVVPLLTKNSISPEFAQFIFRASDSMTKGFTPLLGFFVIYLGYLNVYNTDNEPITIRKALSFVSPYCLLISITWILIVVLMYVVGLPIGPSSYPVL